LNRKLQKLARAMFYETNPVPVKTALAMMGKVNEELRLPLAPLSADNRRRLAAVLEEFELL